MGPRERLPLLLAALGFALLAKPVPAAALPNLPNDDCLACHGDPSGGRFIDPARYAAAIHGGNLCVSCHTEIASLPHAVPLPPVQCATCHTIETEIYLKSDHGIALHQGVPQAASCKSCHGNPHDLLNSRDPRSPIFRANIPATCGRCHSKTEEMARFHLSQSAPVASYEQSVHGLALKEKSEAISAVCTDCHGSHDLHKATNTASKLYWQNLPATCGKCHENIRQTYLRSVHGKAVQAGKRDAPVCTDCHGEHTITAVKRSASKVYPTHIPETCGACHAAERIITRYRLPSHAVETYMESYHGLALQLGSVTAANCASCHGAHDILPSTDSRSSVHPVNLPKTCGKCHAGVSAQVAKGQIHSGTRPGLEHLAVSWVRRIYLALIWVVVGGMLVHNLLDFRRKLKLHLKRNGPGKPAAARMDLNERLQHAVLAVVFVTLAYTGFALKFPQAWWSSPFVGQVDWRGFGHKAAALIFVALAAYHFWFVRFTPRGRKHLAALRPRRIDLVQPFQMLAFYLGRGARPVFARYSYVEKSEYWALIWGSIVMAVTGALMTWEGWTLRVFPKWLFDLVTAIHYYEAILACLAIVVWHFYFTVFDPDEYPMKETWISGRPSAADRAHRRDED